MKKEIEKYLIKKGKEDLLSSLKQLDKKIIEDRLNDSYLNSIEELKEEIIEEFDDCLEFAKNDIFTKMYFQKLMENENTMFMSAYKDDIEALWVFVYKEKNHLSYYIASEIKEIIKEKLNFK